MASMEPVLQKEGLYIGASICRLIHEGGELHLQCLFVGDIANIGCIYCS
jgi:hypothetical protein